MTFYEFSYYIFGVVDLYIVLLIPILGLLNTRNKIILHLLFFITSPTCIVFLSDFSPYIELCLIFIYIYILTKRNILAVCLSLFNYLLSIVLNYGLLAFHHLTHGISELDAITNYPIVYYTLFTVLLLFVSFGLRWLYQHFIGNKLNLSFPFTTLFLVYLGLCAMIFVYNYTYEETQNFPQELVYINTLLFIVFFMITCLFIILLIHMFKRDVKLQTQNVQYKSLQNYTAQVEELYQNLRGFKHDYLNLLTTMDYYVANKDWAALTDFYETKISPTRTMFQNSYQDLGQLQNLEIAEIKSILYNKFVKAVEMNISVTLEIREPIRRLDADPIDIARVLGIYLDNTIDALNAPELSDDQRQLHVAVLTDSDAVVFIIRNTCQEFPLQLQKLGTLNYSTKGEHRGMGLYLARQTLKNYRNIQSTPSYENHAFTQTLTIYPKR